MHRARAAVGYGTNDCFRTGLGWTKRNAMGRARSSTWRPRFRSGVGRPTHVTALENSICSTLKDDSIGSSRMNYNLTTSFRRPVFISPSNAGKPSSPSGAANCGYRRKRTGRQSHAARNRARTPLSFACRLGYGSTEATTVSFCAFFNACTENDISRFLRENRLVAILSVLAQRTRVNNPLDPTRGSAFSAEISHARA